MIKFKRFLTEGTDASTLFEGVIAVCISMSGYSQKRFKDNILKQKEVKVFLKVTKSDWAVDGKQKKKRQIFFGIFLNFVNLNYQQQQQMLVLDKQNLKSQPFGLTLQEKV